MELKMARDQDMQKFSAYKSMALIQSPVGYWKTAILLLLRYALWTRINSLGSRRGNIRPEQLDCSNRFLFMIMEYWILEMVSNWVIAHNQPDQCQPRPTPSLLFNVHNLNNPLRSIAKMNLPF